MQHCFYTFLLYTRKVKRGTNPLDLDRESHLPYCKNVACRCTSLRPTFGLLTNGKNTAVHLISKFFRHTERNPCCVFVQMPSDTGGLSFAISQISRTRSRRGLPDVWFINNVCVLGLKLTKTTKLISLEATSATKFGKSFREKLV